jgi:hypothetical protein
MTTPPKTRDLAYLLLTCEAVASKTSEPVNSATLRVYEKLRQSLTAVAGGTGFQSLACRALVLAKAEASNLGAAQITADGSLQDFGEFEPQIEIGKDRTSEYQASERGIILIARLLGLLHIFLGEALTLSLLRNAWPGEVFDERNSRHGRKA